MTSSAETTVLLERISELEEANANLRRLEATIARNANLFEALLGANQGGIALTRADGSIIRVVREILGYARNSLNGIKMAELVHPQDRDAVLDCYRRLAGDPCQPIQLEVRVRKADDFYQWVEFTITDMLEDPSVLALVHNFRDITGRRRRHLFEAELDALSEQSGAAVFSVDPDGVVQTWHPACERLLGYTSADIEGSDLRLLMPPTLAPAAIESGRASEAIRTELRARDGELKSVELVLAPLAFDLAVAYIARPL